MFVITLKDIGFLIFMVVCIILCIYFFRKGE